MFAVANDMAAGGDVFRTDASGGSPGDTCPWDTP